MPHAHVAPNLKAIRYYRLLYKKTWLIAAVFAIGMSSSQLEK
jgi:hypothetical protein